MFSLLLSQVTDVHNPLTILSSGRPAIEVINILVGNAITLGLIIGSVIFIVIIFLGGISWASSGGDKVAVEQAKSKITNALIGLTILFSIFAIATVIGRIFGVRILQISQTPVTSCPANTILCGTQCVNIHTDPNNCGACGIQCTSGQTCSQGVCTSTVTPPPTNAPTCTISGPSSTTMNTSTSYFATFQSATGRTISGAQVGSRFAGTPVTNVNCPIVVGQPARCTASLSFDGAGAWQACCYVQDSSFATGSTCMDVSVSGPGTPGPAVPTVSITANPSTITVPRNTQFQINLTWTSTNADYCVLQGGTSQATSGTYTVSINSGDFPGVTFVNYSYTATCVNSLGSGTNTAWIRANYSN